MGQYERHVFVCTHGEYCPFEGSVEIHRLLKKEIAARGLQDSIRINKAGCFSQCGNGPMVIVYPENIWYGDVTEGKARRILEELRDINLDTATFAERQDLIAKLGIKVYPSDEGKVVRIACKVHPFTGTSRLSPQIISMASPKL